jgi:hypothetical protein
MISAKESQESNKKYFRRNEKNKTIKTRAWYVAGALTCGSPRVEKKKIKGQGGHVTKHVYTNNPCALERIGRDEM